MCVGEKECVNGEKYYIKVYDKVFVVLIVYGSNDDG